MDYAEKKMRSKPPGFWLDKFTRESRHTRELRHLL